MRAVLQRVTEAAVEVDGTIVGQTGPGLLILVCAMQGDGEENAVALVDKITKLRIFADDAGKMNRSLMDAGGSVLVVSQFTLAADTSRGNRPGFSQAAAPESGKKLYETFVELMRAKGVSVETGQFGAEMKVSLVNDGPATFIIDR